MGGAASAAGGLTRQGSITSPRADRDPQHVYSMQTAGSPAPSLKKTVLLFLGPGGCGKSTLCLQMQATFSEFSKEHRITSSTDIVKSMRKTVAELIEDTVDDEDITDETVELMVQFEEFKDSPGCPNCLEPSYKTQISVMYSLWHAPDLVNAKSASRTRTSYEDILNYTSTNYFLSQEKYEEICTEGFIPSDEDIMKCRRRTDTAEDTAINLSGREILLRDVGGQIYRRCEWKRSFQNVNVVVFIVPLDSYVHREGVGQQRRGHDRRSVTKRNGLLCALDLASDIAITSELLELPMIIIFNKLDCFEELIQTEPITCIPSIKWEPPEEGSWARSSRSEKRGNKHSQHYCDSITTWFVNRVTKKREEEIAENKRKDGAMPASEEQKREVKQEEASYGIDPKSPGEFAAPKVEPILTEGLEDLKPSDEGRDGTPKQMSTQARSPSKIHLGGDALQPRSGTPSPKSKSQSLLSPSQHWRKGSKAASPSSSGRIRTSSGNSSNGTGSHSSELQTSMTAVDDDLSKAEPKPRKSHGIVKSYTVCAFDRDLCSSIVMQIIHDFG